MRCIKLALLGGFLSFCLARSFVVPVLPRQAATITTVLDAVTAVSNSVTSLDTNIKTLTPGNVGALATLRVSSDVMQEALINATSRVQAVPGTLSIPDATTLLGQVSPLVMNAQTAVNDLVAKQDIIRAAGAAGQAVDILTAQKAASLNFASALQVKVPPITQSIASVVAQQVSTAFDGGISTFSAAAAGAPAPANATAAPGSKKRA